MSVFEAIILGIIQGLTEFLPVSSSAHLVITERIMGTRVESLAFELTLHLGTLCAVLFAYRKSILPIIRHPLSKPAKLIIAATIPTVIIVFAFNKMFRAAFSGQYLVYCFLITAVLLLIADRRPKLYNHQKNSPPLLTAGPSSPRPNLATCPHSINQNSSPSINPNSTSSINQNSSSCLKQNSTSSVSSIKQNSTSSLDYGSTTGLASFDNNAKKGGFLRKRATKTDEGGFESKATGKRELGYFDAVVIGITQGFAAFPGISRSGSTISVSMLLGHDKKTSADFSFLLSIPIIIGSSLFELILGGGKISGIGFLPLMLGFLSAFISGLIAIKLLLRVLKHVGFDGFAIYLFCLSLFLLLNDNFLFLF